MGRPDNLKAVVRFQADDVTIYISQELLGKQKPGTRKMHFYVDGYGRFGLTFTEPWRGGEAGDHEA